MLYIPLNCKDNNGAVIRRNGTRCLVNTFNWKGFADNIGSYLFFSFCLHLTLLDHVMHEINPIPVL